MQITTLRHQCTRSAQETWLYGERSILVVPGMERSRLCVQRFLVGSAVRTPTT